jgi:hypothetical protein
MNNRALQLVFKKYWRKEQLTGLESFYLDQYLKNSSKWEVDYFTKLATVNF